MENKLNHAANSVKLTNLNVSSSQGGHPMGSMLPMPPSPSGSEDSGRLSSPLEHKPSSMSHYSNLQHERMSMSSPVSNGPLELTRVHHNNSSSSTSSTTNNNGHSESRPNNGRTSSNNNNNNTSKDYDMDISGSSGMMGGSPPENNGINIHPSAGPVVNNGPPLVPNKLPLHEGMKGMNSMNGIQQTDMRNLMQNPASHGGHPGDLMSMESMRMQAEAFLRSQAAEALRLAVSNNMDTSNNNNNNNNNHSPKGNGPPHHHNAPANNNDTPSPSNNGEGMMSNHMNAMISQHQQHIQQQQQQQQMHPSSSMEMRGAPIVNGHHHPHGSNSSSGGGPGHHLSGHHNHHHRGMGAGGNNGGGEHFPTHHHPAFNHHPHHHQLNSLLSGQQNSELSEALMRLDARSLGFPLPAHNS